ncbi:MAG: hypothetical protein FJ385_00620 [Verrucomicrobia bacterium]|nr:hypothetical protein [Verrucomicrobiota bacterium]
MQVFAAALPWDPAGCPPPLTVESLDWSGAPLRSAQAHALVTDPARLWFFVRFTGPLVTDPAVRAGAFHEGLWHHDVAECFVAGAAGVGYLECNLSPTGAWWACAFDAPRVRSADPFVPREDIRTWCDDAGDGARHVALSLPLAWIESRVGPLASARANITMILESPRQRYVTASNIGGGEPDFHRPQWFPQVCVSPLVPVS